ncbi:hypothetical protein JXA88_18880 [Candidatus Fermentibacteria bacterium]|nr:hypothetical protein [Candidatus Fermentibacteria bacterium]
MNPRIWPLAVLTAITVAAPSNAMPGFARKYRMSCTTCHAPFPRLKDYGDEFAGNGFRLPEGEPARATVDTGDPILELARDVSLGFRMDSYITYEDDGDPSENDLKTPYNLKIISGGPIARSLSYYFYFFLSERGEIAGIEDAFVFLSNLFNSGVNLTIGQFAVSDPLLKGELRLTYEGYEVFKRAPPNSSSNLKYDRGVVLDYGTPFGMDLVLQVVNGNGIGEGSGASKNLDSDNGKNVMFRAAQALGPASVGGFVYHGTERRDGYDNTVHYLGGDLSVARGPAQMTALYLRRTDANGYFLANEQEVVSDGLIVEATVVPSDKGRWAFAALYNWFDSDYALEWEDLGPRDGIVGLDYETLAINASYLLARNARCMAEYTRILKDESRAMGFKNKNRFLAGISVGF